MVNLLGLSLYTRLLSPEEYGRYALLQVSVGIVNAVGFHWLRVAAIRYLPAAGEKRVELLRALFSTYRYVALGLGGACLLGLTVVHDSVIRGFIAVGLFLLWCQTWFELNLDLRLASLEPIRYGILAAVRAILATFLGAVLAYLGFGGRGVAVGAAIGFLVPGIVGAPKEALSAVFARPDWVVVRRVLSFGLPLTGISALGVITGAFDRTILGWVAGALAVGQYAAAADLASQSVGALMSLVNLSAVPLAVRAYESGGTTAASAQLGEQAVALFALAFPATVGIALLAPDLASVLLGDSFRESAGTLIPLIATAAFFGGLKAFYFDLAFQLAGATSKLLRIGVVTAIVGMVLNLWLIPGFGATGAAYAMVATFGASCILSAVLGRRVFPLPVPIVTWMRICVAGMAMAVALWFFPSSRGGAFHLALRVTGGAMVYAVVALVLNVGGIRSALGRGFRS